ncbi:MAG TPA: hypothetical protein VHN11_00655 [Xanthobacteraceae bacterium]|jgi:hypothetical protein|nr:hypothetical protein [Xanthobacteraceae bacterium]
MVESKDREELEQRLAQAKRIANAILDPVTKERLQGLKEQLRLSKPKRRYVAHDYGCLHPCLHHCIFSGAARGLNW